jgi:hypothetical protein
MAKEQGVLSGQVETMIRELLVSDYRTEPPNIDLHVGVVTTDMDDPATAGVLRSEGQLPGCQPRYTALDCELDEGCPWLSHSLLLPDDGIDSDAPPLWEDLACIAAVGTGGSSQEQPFEAALRALTAMSEPGMPNHGFLRENSLLAIFFITDEDDCSGLVGADDAEPGVECILHEDELTSIADVHDALVDLRAGDLNRIVVSAIVGIPFDGSWSPGDPIEELRALRLIEGAEPAPGCEGETSLAYPPPRIAELVYSFENNGVLESICQDDWTRALQVITFWDIDIRGVCLPRLLQPETIRTCHVELVLEDREDCLGLADRPGPERSEGWSADLGLDEEGRRRCEVLPADLDLDGCPDGALECPPDWDASDGGLDGWFVDWTNMQCEYGVLTFTDRAVSAIRSELHIRCIDDPCPALRSCPEALSEAPSCDEGCEESSVCVEHRSGEICGWMELSDSTRWPLQCWRCSPTVGAWCSIANAAYDAPLIGPGGCCAEGFHCDADGCVPDRTTSCTAR